MKKRMLAVLLTVCMMLSLVPIGVLADDVPTSGTCGENATWTFDPETGTLTISGTGEVVSFFGPGHSFDRQMINGVKALVVEKGITGISAGFEQFLNMESVRIADSVTTIRNSFGGFKENGEAYGTAWFRNQVAAGQDVFVNGILLYTQTKDGAVIVPEYITTVAGGAIRNAKTVVFPKSVTEVCSGAVTPMDNPDLEEVTILNPYCSFEEIVLPDQIGHPYPSAFGAAFNVDFSGSYMLRISDLTIRGYVDSTAQQYCEEVNMLPELSEEECWYIDRGGSEEIKGWGKDWTFVALDKPTEPDKPAIPTINFADVPESEYFATPVSWAVSKGITNGTSETTFSPNDSCTRAQAVTFLWRAANSPEPASTSNPFTDVPADQYYYKAVLWAVEKGITNGVDATHFGPDTTCNRAQIVTFLHRYEGEPGASGNGFDDVPAGEYYYAPVIWAVSRGVTNGVSATEFGPGSNCTRGQIVTFLYRDVVG